MSRVASPKQWVKDLAAGRKRTEALIVPLAFRIAARIQERQLDEFLTDPTQLANGLLELFEAVGADGIVCALANGVEREASGSAGCHPDTIISAPRLAASLEATRRLRITVGDRAALVAGLTGPATLAEQCGDATGDLPVASRAVAGLVRHFCEAGCDIVILFDSVGATDLQGWHASLRTISNIVRFHRGLTFLIGDKGPLLPPVLVPVGAVPQTVTGLVVTPAEVPLDTDLGLLRTWIDSLRAAVPAELPGLVRS